MGPKTAKRLDELREEYRAACKEGELARAVRLLTRINRIENGEPEAPLDEESV